MRQLRRFGLINSSSMTDVCKCSMVIPDVFLQKNIFCICDSVSDK